MIQVKKYYQFIFDSDISIWHLTYNMWGIIFMKLAHSAC